MSKKPRPSKQARHPAKPRPKRASDRGAGEQRTIASERDRRDDRLLMAEQLRHGFAAVAGTSHSEPSAAMLPGFAEADAALLDPLQALPTPVTARQAPRTFAPIVHKAEPAVRET